MSMYFHKVKDRAAECTVIINWELRQETCKMMNKLYLIKENVNISLWLRKYFIKCTCFEGIELTRI